jgi:hypothetical protein
MINSEMNGHAQQAPTYATDTRKQENHRMNQRLQEETALWHCETCQIWWGSGNNMREAATLMQNVAKMTFPLAWDEYRGWRSGTAIVTCPQCGQPAKSLSNQHTFLQEEPLPQHQHHPYLEVAL